jgi:putative oxidoreductase
MIDVRTAPYAALLLRVSLGVLFLAHAAVKIFSFTPAGTAQFFGKIGLPPELAYLVMLAETAGGVALVLGVWTRVVAIALTPILFGAIWTVHYKSWVFSAPGGGWEYLAFWIVALIVQSLLGNGAFSLRVPGMSSVRVKPA